MPKHRSVLLLVAVIALLLVGLASAYAEFTPVAAVADTRWAALIAAVAAVLLAGRRAVRPVGGPRGVWGLLAALGLGVAAWAAVLLFGTYREERVVFRSGAVRLAGTLLAPRTDGPHPAVVYLHGAGRERRREFGYEAKLYARHGVAALAYDKRGAGESGGDTYDTDYRGYAADAAAAIRYLCSRADIRCSCVGLFGQSQGGWVAPVVAAETVPGVAFVVVRSSTPLSPADQVLYETGRGIRDGGFTEADVREATALQRRVLEYQRSGPPDPALSGDLAAAAKKPWFRLAKLPPELYDRKEYDWWRSVMDFQTGPLWKRVRAPVLAISGGRDPKSDAHASQEEIRQLLAAGGNRDFTGVLYPKMEHGGIEWRLGVRIPPPRFPEGYPELLVRWTGERIDRCR